MFGLIDPSLTIHSSPGVEQQKSRGPGSGSSFKDMLNSALQAVNDAQLEADRAAAALAVGDIQDVHQVMIATEKANIALQLTISIRNQVIDAYQEISRMQI